jgi:DNA-binding NtrC family response regulator
MATVLVVDDDRNLLTVLKGLLEREGLAVLTASHVDAALAVISRHDIDLIITDLKMPGKSGLDLLALSRERVPAAPAIMITAHGDVETAVTAMKRGAYDFITKPFDEEELVRVVNKAVAESAKNRQLVSAYFDEKAPPLPEVIGRAPAIEQLLGTVRKIAATDSTVLITGETGVGKELIARAVHLSSGRRDHPFIKVNCAAIPETLLESELFGYEKGAFTGATTNKPGRFELAHLGTLFLDEIGEMPLSLQSRLLGVLQDKAFERVGGVKTIMVDMRIIAATNRDLPAAVREGKFRSDLFYRLNVVPIHVPPLRERKDDVPPLVDHFLRRFASKHGKTLPRVAPEVMAAFARYDWPGNIRELENALERMVVLCDSGVFDLEYVPPEIRGPLSAGTGPDLKETVGMISQMTEKQMIVDALEKTGQNRTKAAELLHISRRTLQNKIKEYGL